MASEKPVVADLHGDGHYAQVARKNWLGAVTNVRVKQDIVKSQIWDELEKESFPTSSLILLENLQILEKYLWPGYNEDASNFHVLLLALIITVKRREHLPSWELLVDKPVEFSSFFRRLLSISLDASLVPRVRTHLLVALVGAFQSLDNGLVRKECAPLVSISIWHNLHNESIREEKIEKQAQLKKAWRAAKKRYEAADDAVKARLRFERSWLFTLILDFLNILYDTSRQDADNSIYCERFMEFLSDLQSQFPTRRYVNTLLKDLHILTAVQLSTAYNNGDGVMRDFHALLRHFTNFPLDDHTGQQLTPVEIAKHHSDALAHLQRVALKNFKDRLQLLALSNYGSLNKRSELEIHLQPLTDDDLRNLCMICGYRTDFPSTSKMRVDRNFLMEVLLSAHEKRSTYQETVKDMSTLPTELSLYEISLLRNEIYNGSRPLAIPKLNLQYLTTGDFLWRSFILYRCESFYEIRKDMEEQVKRLKPALNGSSRMALRITKPAIIEVLPPKVGEQFPAQVKAEIILDVSRMHDNVRKEWDSLRKEDVVFLLSIAPVDSSNAITNGHSTSSLPKRSFQILRSAQISQVLDGNGKPLRAAFHQTNGHHSRPRQRRLILNLDPVAYQLDMAAVAKGKSDVYESINFIVRRGSRENNFHAILETIKGLTLSETQTTLPSWLQDVFLGLGDPASATYQRLPTALKVIDYRDTFLDFQHMADSFPGKTIERADGKLDAPLNPPFVIETSVTEKNSANESTRLSRKRRRDEVDVQPSLSENLIVSTYQPANTGPYPSDLPKLNTVRFTPTQTEAITSGTQLGLTVVVGPPGTGKTDVATQIINNIYHNFPEQRTLLVAHSNQALNQLFQKIVALDIDERHLLRLGHGEGELQLDNNASYSKHGRAESLLERGAILLSEVNRLARSLNAPGAHGSSCETAEYFNLVYVEPIWVKYCKDFLDPPETTIEAIVEAFPFHNFFSNAPNPLFPDGSRSSIVDIVLGCYRHISKIFSELSDIRPFEVLRNDRAKSNYLLIKEARIIAMTSTHAAMRRHEIASLGFQYDNVVMEEAAQVTEVENFIPFALQVAAQGKPSDLKRIVLCGDHLQNSPIIQNLAFRQYANLEQSLFLRLVRLGVPTIMLDEQGRARPSLAELYKFRYPHLGNLPSTQNSSEFIRANAGFRHDYQFIDVSDYKGRGETEPSPHFTQNLGEAEYAVALFMYMRLLGYSASKISILTTYAGQRALIKDVLNHRCAKNRLFGLPRVVTTVDKYQGEQNDYIILSLVRTTRPGYLRDIRRFTVALSRARLGLYILGRREVFETCLELQQAFELFWKRSNKLLVVTGEMFPATRLLDDEVEATPMEGVEHLGKYVFEMTQAKIANLKEGVESLPLADESIVETSKDDEYEEGDGLMQEEIDEDVVDDAEDEDPNSIE